VFAIKLGVNVSDQRISYNGMTFNVVKVHSVNNNSLASKCLRTGDFIVYIQGYAHPLVFDIPENDKTKTENEPTLYISKHASSIDMIESLIGWNDTINLEKMSEFLSSLSANESFIISILRDGKFIDYHIDHRYD
jgi:hypothetical protein